MGTVELFRGLIAVVVVMVPAVGAYLGHKLSVKHAENQRTLMRLDTSINKLSSELSSTREQFVEFRGTVTQQMKALEKYR